jgi:hypothetical protein
VTDAAGLGGVFASAVLPVVAVACVGFALARLRDVDPEPLNTAVVYVLAPALVFHSLATTDLGGGTLARLAGAVGAYHLGMLAVSEVAARVAGVDEPVRSALVLTATFPNSGNYGIPLSAFAFGAVGRSTAVVFLAVQSVLVYTVGAYVAARSGGDGGLAGLRQVVRLPLVYAVVAALAARAAGVVPPEASTVMTTTRLVGDAAIPVMLLVLGIQLANTDYGAALSRVPVPTVLKTGVAPAVGLAVALAVGLGAGPGGDPAVARTFVLETATPAAVTPLVLVGEFGGDADGPVGVVEYVSATVLVTTLVSVPVLTALVALLRAGVLV